jgi:type I restriction enzyme, S subunit
VTTQLGPLCSFLNGGTPSRAVDRYYSGDIPWITGSDITGPIVTTARSFITEEAIRESATSRVPAGTVLLVTRTSVGKVAIAGMPLCFSQDITALMPDPQRLDTQYLVHFLRLQQQHLQRVARGATIKGVTREAVENLTLPLLALPKQRRIAAILDKADALRAKRRAAVAQLDTLTQSIFLDMFGDPAKNPRGWPEDSLGALITVGPQNGLYKPASDYGSGTPILRIDAFYGGVVTGLKDLKRVRVSEKERAVYGLRPGEIVINRVNSREYLGKSALIPALPEPVIFESNMMRLGVDPTRMNPVFLIALLQTQHIRAHILRSAKDAVNQSSINQRDVMDIPLIVPPLLRQEMFARHVTLSESLADRQAVCSAELDALFASLQHRAFQGEL